MRSPEFTPGQNGNKGGKLLGFTPGGVASQPELPMDRTLPSLPGPKKRRGGQGLRLALATAATLAITAAGVGVGIEVSKSLRNNDSGQTETTLGFPSFPPSVPAENITPETTGKSPQELAKEAGYSILWMDPNDTTGRTVFYDGRGGWGGGIGESYSGQDGTDGKIYRHLGFLTGQFVRFENIEGSKDKYIILKDPKTGDLFQKIRVDLEGKINTTVGLKPTGLSIENLSFKQDPIGTAVSFQHNSLGYIPQWSEAQLAKILQPGDAVGVSPSWVYGISTASWAEEGNTKTEVVKNPFAGDISIKRFGGKAQIEKELASP